MVRVDDSSVTPTAVFTLLPEPNLLTAPDPYFLLTGFHRNSKYIQ